MGTKPKITLDEYATTLIRLKARQLVGKYAFTKSDREDIQQDLTLDLLMRLKHFDPSKGKPATFVRLVVDRCVASMIRERKSLARDYRRTRHSLDELSDEIGNGNLAEPAVDDRHPRDLAIDLTAALCELPPDQQSIAVDLCDDPLAVVARAHHCSREAMRRSARQIRQHLAQCGLDAYVSAHQIGEPSRK